MMSTTGMDTTIPPACGILPGVSIRGIAGIHLHGCSTMVPVGIPGTILLYSTAITIAGITPGAGIAPLS